MTKIPAMLGAIVLAASSLIVAASMAQQPAGGAGAPGSAPAQEPKAPSLSPEQKAVADAVEAFSKAYSAADTKALGELFTDEVVVIDPDGVETRGKAAAIEMYAASFQENPGLKLESRVAEVRFITPDVARVEGQTRLTAESDAAAFTRFSGLLVRKDGKWRSAEIREFAAPAEDITPYERLKDLEWMVGHWVDESENSKVESDVRWADNNSYLIRTYTHKFQNEKGSSGTMFIGWDPQTGQIKSWVFDSEGGHGEGYWTRTGENEWIVKAQGVLRDGRPNSATQVHTILNKDSVKTSSIDRIIGGEVAPDITDVVMVRKPPQPTTGAVAPGPAPSNAPR